MSAARLAAESMFSAPPPLVPEHQPTVVVRKARIAHIAHIDGDQAGQPDAPAAVVPPTAEDDIRSPRIFRVALVPTAVEDKRVAALNAPVADAPVADATMAGRVKLAVHMPAPDHKRPGPVVQIYSAPPQPASDELPAPAPVQHPSQPGPVLSSKQAEVLRNRLAKLNETIDDIQRAESLSFADRRIAAVLNELTRGARAMRGQMDMRLR